MVTFIAYNILFQYLLHRQFQQHLLVIIKRCLYVTLLRQWTILTVALEGRQ